MDKEIKAIEAGLRRSYNREQFEIITKWAVSPRDLRRALLDHKPQIVHFSGHGVGQEGLILENEISNGPKLVSASALASLFELFKNEVECVLLNACYAEVQAEAIGQHIHNVVGMKQAIEDTAALEFAVGFYDALGAGRSYANAFEFGKAAIALEGLSDTSTPVFKQRKLSFSHRSENKDNSQKTEALRLLWRRLLVGPSLSELRKILHEIELLLEEYPKDPESELLKAEIKKDFIKEETVLPKKSIEELESYVPRKIKVEFCLINEKAEIIENHESQTEYYRETLDNGGVTLDLIKISGDIFKMGCPIGEAGGNTEMPQHKVQINEFWIGKYPVTQEQWQYIASMPKVSKDLEPKPSAFEGKTHPVECVSWYDAKEFCQRLTQATGISYRLPTEAEWEYACRAKRTSPFYFGPTIASNLANYNGKETYCMEQKGKYRKQTTSVGSFYPNRWGIYDMHGNVWEWCLDHWHSNYGEKPENLKQNGNTPWISLNENTDRILRGGSWKNFPRRCRAAHRFRHQPGVKLNCFGFRIACSIAYS
ncbi:SUMF1/EgtB/PvdO family nonheme iron enzyme [Leptothoe sp. LEGE 181152]|nr:SUMF1/EgtB/PvdO family nonheme iron enzyme [Leptothoe sp. LEGE 181152]